MTNSVNVINKVGCSVDVKVNEINGGVQIIIDVPQSSTELSLLKPGDVFEKNNIEYIVCEQFEDGTTAVVRKDCLDRMMEFGDNNNWKESKWREHLNKEYLREVEADFEAENIVEHDVDLTSLDGYDDYGVSVDKVSIMNVDRYRKYHKYIGDTGECHFLSTPDSTPSGTGSSCVLYVRSGGNVDWYACGWNRDVRPFFILKSSITVSFDQSRS